MKKFLTLALTLVVALSLTFAGNEGKKAKTGSPKKALKSCCEGMTSKDCSDVMPDCDPKDAKMSKKAGETKTETKSEVKTEAPKGDRK